MHATSYIRCKDYRTFLGLKSELNQRGFKYFGNICNSNNLFNLYLDISERAGEDVSERRKYKSMLEEIALSYIQNNYDIIISEAYNSKGNKVNLTSSFFVKKR